MKLKRLSLLLDRHKVGHHSPLSHHGTEKLLCVTLSTATLRGLEVDITTFTDCLHKEAILASLVKEHSLVFGQLQHENITRSLGFSCEDHRGAFVSERSPETLSGKLFSAPPSTLSPSQRLHIALGVSLGLASLHSLHSRSAFSSFPPSFPLHAALRPSPQIHGNLTAENIQLARLAQSSPAVGEEGGRVEYVARLSNTATFSIARRYLAAQSPSAFLLPISPAAYPAPECRSGHFDQKTDIFAFGVLLIELLTGRPARSVMEGVERGLSSPANSTSFSKRFRDKFLDPSLGWGDTLWTGLFDLAKWCLRRAREDRPEAAAVVDSLSELVRQLDTPIQTPPPGKGSATRAGKPMATESKSSIRRHSSALAQSSSPRPRPSSHRVATANAPSPRTVKSSPGHEAASAPVSQRRLLHP
jgi:hypothetical protein